MNFKSCLFNISRLLLMAGVMYFSFGLTTSSLLLAQASSTPANTLSPVVSPTYSDLTVSMSSFSFNLKDNIKDNDLTNKATWGYVVGGSAWIEVKDNLATGPNEHKGGSYVGFVLDENAVNVISKTTIKTYLGNTEQDAKSFGDLIVIEGLPSGKSRVGFVTTPGKNFDRIRIEFSAMGVLGTIGVYHAEIIKYEGNVPVPCGSPTALRLSDGSNPGFPVQINQAQTKIEGACVGCSVTDALNLIDGDATTSAKISLPLSVGTGSGSISVKSAGQTYPAGTFAGFDLNSPSIIGVGVTNGMKIETFLGGVSKDVFANGSFAVGVTSSLLSGSGRQIVGFLATQEFDEIKLTISKTGVSLGTTEVFSAMVTNFCNDAELACNTLTTVKNPEHAVYINGAHTGITSVACAACTINDAQHVIDDIDNAPASIVLTAGVAASASFAVSNAMTTYGANSFAGFEIETKTLLSAEVISKARVHLLLDGEVVQEMTTGNQLIVGATSGVLVGRSRQIVGVVANPGITYNGVKITFDQLVGADLGTINIYGAIFDKTCSGTIACNNTYNLNMPGIVPASGEPNFPTVINAARTGFEGAACAACYIKDPWNAVSSSTTDFAQIGNILDGVATGSLAVLDPISTYPAGTFAGFTIKKNNFLVSADLFGQFTIRTYNNGVFQEEASGASLLNLAVITQIFGSAADFYNPGFVTTKPFDEIRISVGSLLGLGLDHSVDVYGAFVDTRTAEGGALLCFTTNPDNNVTRLGMSVTGDVSTNDNVPPGTTYGNPTGTGNPSTDVPVVNPDGSYSFTPTVAGVYSFIVPVCAPGQTSDCATENLTINVLNITVRTNRPAAHDDIASMEGSDTSPNPITVDVKSNDRPGNPGSTLGDPVVPVQPLHGTTSIVAGEIVYTPASGFYGEDVVTYQVCESPSGLCTSAQLVITVLEGQTPHSLSASDDYANATKDEVLTVDAANGVLMNDYDSDGNTLTVTEETTSIDDVGTLVMESDGGYTFTPASGYTGPANYVYTVCDGAACETSTLYILVNEPPSALPVTLAQFAVVKEQTLAHLSWTTTEERNSNFFEVQHSTDARSWKALGTVATNDKGKGVNNYNFMHTSPVNGSNYYRLKMVDKDETFAYSGIKAVSFENMARIRLYPNPVTDFLIIEAREPGNLTSVEVVSASGVTVYRSNLMPARGIDVKNLTTGIYIVKLAWSDGTIDKHKTIVAR